MHRYRAVVAPLIGAVCVVSTASLSAATFTPVHGATNVSPDVVLIWSDYGPATSYDVYFSTDFDEVNNATHQGPPDQGTCNLTSGNYDPYGTYSLNKNTTYYWRVDRIDGQTIEQGPVLSFTTVTSVSVSSRKTTFLMPMRDGVGIYTELYMPLGMGPFPTIFFKTTYGPEVSQGSFDRGYVQVVQTQRGRGGSQGQGFCFISDVDDSYDAIEWIRSQSWSDGMIGGQGVSGPGIIQEMAAASGTDGLTAQWVGLSSGNVFETVFQGGAFRQALVEGWFTAVGYDVNYHMQTIEAHPADGHQHLHTGPSYPSRILLPVIPAIPADFDGDDDVDLDDFAKIQACISGSGVPVTDPDCYPCRLNGSVDVDTDDIQIFLGCLSGANIPADPACAD